MTVGLQLYSLLFGTCVGQDDAGNRYYTNKKQSRRWVLYQGEEEASKVPPVWHAWLHHGRDTVPTAADINVRPWLKPHQENLTGSDKAFRPAGHITRGGRRVKATGDYEPWQPM